MATIHGDNTMMDDVRAGLKGLMDGLKAAMDATGTDPGPNTVYDRHESIVINLPAITVEPISSIAFKKQSGYSSGGAFTLPKIVTCEIRVHTDCEGGYADTVKIQRLLNSVQNYLNTHGNNYFHANIPGFLETDYDNCKMTWLESYAESLTIGGSLAFNMVVEHTHNQS